MLVEEEPVHPQRTDRDTPARMKATAAVGLVAACPGMPLRTTGRLKAHPARMTAPPKAVVRPISVGQSAALW